MSQLNPIGELVVLESVPTISKAPRQQERTDNDVLEKQELDVEDDSETIKGRCLALDSSEDYKEVSWTAREQRAAVRKIDFFLLPIFMVSAFMTCSS
jgi:hypothetical protein